MECVQLDMLFQKKKNKNIYWCWVRSPSTLLLLLHSIHPSHVSNWLAARRFFHATPQAFDALTYPLDALIDLLNSHPKFVHPGPPSLALPARPALPFSFSFLTFVAMSNGCGYCQNY